MGKVQSRISISNPSPANAPSQAVVEVSENIRAKVYTIFSKLGKYIFYKFFLKSAKQFALFCRTARLNNDMLTRYEMCKLNFLPGDAGLAKEQFTHPTKKPGKSFHVQAGYTKLRLGY